MIPFKSKSVWWWVKLCVVCLVLWVSWGSPGAVTCISYKCKYMGVAGWARSGGRHFSNNNISLYRAESRDSVQCLCEATAGCAGCTDLVAGLCDLQHVEFYVYNRIIVRRFRCRADNDDTSSYLVLRIIKSPLCFVCKRNWDLLRNNWSLFREYHGWWRAHYCLLTLLTCDLNQIGNPGKNLLFGYFLENSKTIHLMWKMIETNYV